MEMNQERQNRLIVTVEELIIHNDIGQVWQGRRGS